MLCNDFSRKVMDQRCLCNRVFQVIFHKLRCKWPQSSGFEHSFITCNLWVCVSPSWMIESKRTALFRVLMRRVAISPFFSVTGPSKKSFNSFKSCLNSKYIIKLKISSQNRPGNQNRRFWFLSNIWVQYKLEARFGFFPKKLHPPVYH